MVTIRPRLSLLKCQETTNLHSRKCITLKDPQQNYLESVPLAFVLAALAELNGGDRRWIAGALSALFAFRISHAELGIVRPAGLGLGRPVGFFGTMGVLGGLAGYAAFLVKGFWGF